MELPAMSPNIDVPFFRILSDSYGRLLGKPLVPAGMSAAEGARWLYEAAPFGILAHGVAADPVFVYGNARAQAIFGYDWDELTALPSRFSAEPMGAASASGFSSRWRGTASCRATAASASRSPARASGSSMRPCGNSRTRTAIIAVKRR
jgi:hypothetical protein